MTAARAKCEKLRVVKTVAGGRERALDTRLSREWPRCLPVSAVRPSHGEGDQRFGCQKRLFVV